jgi:large-conductance mechanosensitive channel
MSDTEKKKIAWSLWIPVILAFLLVSAAWFTLIKIAKANPTATVELDQTETKRIDEGSP